MLIKLIIFTFLTFCGLTINAKVYDYQPQQVHIAFGGMNEWMKKNVNDSITQRKWVIFDLFMVFILQTMLAKLLLHGQPWMIQQNQQSNMESMDTF